MFFLGRGDASEDVVFFDEFVIVVGLFGGEVETFGIFYADTIRDFGDGIEVVARDDSDIDVVIVEIVDDVACITADFVFEANVAEKLFVLDDGESAVALGSLFDFFDEGFVVGDEVDGAEEVGGIFGFDAGMLAFGGKTDDFRDTLYFFNIGVSRELLLQSGYGCVFGRLMR